MSNPIQLPLDDSDRLYDPPLLDSLSIEPRSGDFAILFVPSDHVSDEPTELVRFAKGTADFRRVDAFVQEITAILRRGPIDRIVHAGGGNYSIIFADGGHMQLPDTDHSGVTEELSDRLKQIAYTAELAFRLPTPSKST